MDAILKIRFYLDKPLLLTLNTVVCKVISNRFAFRVTAVTLDGELDRKGKKLVNLFLTTQLIPKQIKIQQGNNSLKRSSRI